MFNSTKTFSFLGYASSPDTVVRFSIPLLPGQWLGMWMLLLIVLPLWGQNENNPKLHFSALNFEGAELHQVAIVEDSLMGYCWEFDGESSYADLGDFSLDQDYSMELWFRPEQLEEQHRGLFGQGQQFWLRTSAERKLHFTQPEVKAFDPRSPRLSNGKWMHLFLTKRQDHSYLYLNGEALDTFALKKDPRTPHAHPFYIGRDAWQQYFKGRIKSFAYWDSCLSPESISKRYTDGQPQVHPVHNLLFAHSMEQEQDGWSEDGSVPVRFHEVTFAQKGSTTTYYATFNGQNSKIDLLNSTAPDEEIAIALWVRPESTLQEKGAFVSIGNRCALRTHKNKLLFTLPQIADFNSPDGSLPVGRWQHVTLNYKVGAYVEMYIDGKRVMRRKSPDIPTGSQEIRIGENLWNNHFRGGISQILIYRRLLDKEEIERLARMDNDAFQSIYTALPQNEVDKDGNEGYWLLLLLLLTALPYFYLKGKSRNPRSRRTPSVRRTEPAPGHLIVDEYDLKEEVVAPHEQERKLHKLKQHIEEHLSDPAFDIAQLCQEMGMSRTVLYAFCKEQLHQAPKELLRDLRMERARSLLLQSDASVTAIMEAVGYESRSAFNAAFKKSSGCTPTEYRKQKEN